ncbi:DUF5819 family protein [Streptomyces sp. CT34]|uniref:DUF5819 family protein n=1 Tax=Streptomyces sp. CT34 TaxID=1553907 RepID=UPI0012FED7BA|nr:DUF5819 family protein [Streptomyces sp. CT34]
MEDFSSEKAPIAQWSRSRRYVLWATGAAVSLALAFHFCMTALYNAPFNPIKEKYGDKITAYMVPYFGQNWNLFAPEPIDRDQGVLVRAQKRQPDGSRITTGWTDVTSPGLQKLYGERLWPSRQFRVTAGVPQQLSSWRDPEIEKLRKTGKSGGDAGDQTKRKKQGVEGNLPLTRGEKDSVEQAIRFTQSFASSEAMKLWGPDIELVQVRLVTNIYPRFSQRHVRGAQGKVSYYDLAWLKPVKVAR